MAVVVPRAHAPLTHESGLPLRQVCNFHLQQAPNGGGRLKIIAAIIDAPLITRIVTDAGPLCRVPPRGAAQLVAVELPGRQFLFGRAVFVRGC